VGGVILQMISGLLGTSEKKISPSFLPVYPIHKVKGSFAETKEGRKEDPPPNFWSPQNSKDFQVPSSPIGSLSSQRTHYQQQQQQQLCKISTKLPSRQGDSNIKHFKAFVFWLFCYPILLLIV
jgi:hypothetical protein